MFVPRKVTWADVREHMINRLMIDAEWKVDGDEEFTWWPTPFAQRVAVSSAGDFDDGENWIRVTASTAIASADEDLGVRLAFDYAHWYPVGALIWNEGWLSLTTSLSLNPRCRGLLDWLHQAALIQAAVALRLASEWRDTDGIELSESAHPESGPRHDADELVEIYACDRFGLQSVSDVRKCYENARPHLRDALLGGGYAPGYVNEDVDYFTLDDDGFDLGIGFLPHAWQTERYGLGLFVRARILGYGQAFDEQHTNLANTDIAMTILASQFGRVTGGEEAELSGSLMEAYIPHATLAEWRKDPQQMAVSISNAAAHVAAVAQMFRHRILGFPWPGRDGDT
jgi:hypothetical protein